MRTRFHFWTAGVDYVVLDVDKNDSWIEAIERNGYRGGSFKLPVVVHGDKAWWDITDHAELARDLKQRQRGASSRGEQDQGAREGAPP